MLADLTEHTAQQQARIILLDTTPATWPLQPSARLLRLAHADLPWGATLPTQQPPPAAARPPRPHPTSNPLSLRQPGYTPTCSPTHS